MIATIYQKWGVQHVNGAGRPPYEDIYNGGYRAIFFRPEDPSTPLFITEAKGHGFEVVGLWFADPTSADSVAHGIRWTPNEFADDVAEIVRDIDEYRGANGRTGQSSLVQLNIEFAGKGYPNWKAGTQVLAWHRLTEAGYEWQTWKDGKCGDTKPNFFAGGPGVDVADGSVTWHCLGRAAFDGWTWNETMMARLRRRVALGGLPTRPVVVQPMGHQDDFNYGAYLKEREYNVINGEVMKSPACRISPQAYNGSLYPSDVTTAVDNIVQNGYVPSYYDGLLAPKSYIHPTLVAANSPAYVAKLKALGKRGCTIFREDYMDAADFTAYKSLMPT